MQTAACCLRSTKDRAVHVQRQLLHRFARPRGLITVEDLAYAVESGKDEDRPGFQRLIQAVRDRAHGFCDYRRGGVTPEGCEESGLFCVPPSLPSLRGSWSDVVFCCCDPQRRLIREGAVSVLTTLLTTVRA